MGIFSSPTISAFEDRHSLLYLYFFPKLSKATAAGLFLKFFTAPGVAAETLHDPLKVQPLRGHELHALAPRKIHNELPHVR
jgi:hypothetical protein